MDEIQKKRMDKSSGIVRNSLPGKLKVAEGISAFKDVNELLERAKKCNRRKDLLHLLLSYPMKTEADPADLFLLRDNFIKLNRIIKRLEEVQVAERKQRKIKDMNRKEKHRKNLRAGSMEENVTHDTNLDELMETDIPALLEDVERCLAKYDFDLHLYYASLRWRIKSVQQERYRHIGGAEQYNFAIRQILHCIKGGQLKVIGISGQDAEMVTQDLEDLPEIRSMFEVVISVCVSQCQNISEVRTGIAEQIHKLVGTEISLPLDEALKPYKFLLFLHCGGEKTDLHDLKIPEHGSVVLTARTMNIYQIMPVDLEIKTVDLLLPWMLFWENVEYFPAVTIEQMALQLIEACHYHLLSIILLARALRSVTEVRVWKLALQELMSSSKLSSPVEEGTSEVMVGVLKFIWERKSIVTRHCIKHLCTSVTEDIKLETIALVSCWIGNGLFETEREGNDVLKDLIDSFLLEEVDNGCVRMRVETRDVLLKQFIPHLRPLYLTREGLVLSEEPEVVDSDNHLSELPEKPKLSVAPVVVEWVVDENYLNNNNLSELPEKPICPSLAKLFLQKNYDLMEIPISFFECMPKLRVLDLSHTSIKSLPTSISRLVSLQEFFLRGCDLLMELPHEIGALSKLQVLDLEGTEIMHLPREISRLEFLECLKVSLYGYGSSYREAKKIRKRIPTGLLASLRMLRLLSIDVNPDDDEWIADIKHVTYELLKLRRLRTLKLYFPEVELLKEIRFVRNFKLTVGHHKQRIIFCLPHAVAEEFEKQENYLKYINGKDIPTEIKDALQRTSAFFLERHWTVKNLSEFGNENMVKLKFCLLVECNELQTIIDGGDFYTEGDHICESGIDKTLVLESLEYLGIHCMMNLTSIWEGPIGKGCLSKLKSLALHTCPNLTAVFTTSLLGNLDNLEQLIIEDCPQINSLVSRESSCFESNWFLPSLKKMSLLDLPELVSISSGLYFAPKLERIIIYACPMLESLSIMELSSNDLKVVKGEIEWWNSLKWLESEWNSRQKDYMASVFVELKRDASLMYQLAESGNSLQGKI